MSFMADSAVHPKIRPTPRPRTASGDAIAPSGQSDGALTDDLLRLAEDLYAQQAEKQGLTFERTYPESSRERDKRGRRRHRVVKLDI